MKSLHGVKTILALALMSGLAVAGYYGRDLWLPLIQDATPAETSKAAPEASGTSVATTRIIVSEQTQGSLKLKAKPLKTQTFWKTIQVPGMVVDRPGVSDRGVVAPATGVVATIAYLPGDTVRPGDVLFTIKLLSESVHMTQTELFKATQDIKLAQAQKKRLEAASAAISQARLIEVDSQILRLEIAAKAYRQELLTRGLDPEKINGVAEGKIVREIPIVVPSRPVGSVPLTTTIKQAVAGTTPTFEVQELKVELGQQVQAGQTLCILANHQTLAVEGRAFRDETPLLERSVKEHWPAEIDFQENAGSDWPPLDQTFLIKYLANTIDPVKRTFAFLMPLENQARIVTEDGRTQMLWRFRPGQKVRVLVRAQKLGNVFVLPADAVAHEGADAYVFTQNVNTFERKPVRVLLRDRQQVIVANDGALVPSSFVVRSGAAQLSRMMRTQPGALPKGYHMHADGSLHKNEDE